MSSPSAAFVALEHVSKRFRRGVRHTTLSSLLPSAIASLVGRQRGERESFWALRDLSFEVRAGEALGIIGPNGSGKSTVLKLLAGVLRPDAGSVRVVGRRGTRGRVGALIELAAGFHYELTGRENVYLQGAVLGMRRSETNRQFDAIVDFADVADAIDTPVKRYSSGMLARLGFSIAVHLDADVLLIDEVLSVGDLSFQQRAFKRLQGAVADGRPAVVVSHQLERVLALCHKAVLLTRGEAIRAGSAAECVAAYVADPSPAPANGAALELTAISDPVPAHVPPGGRVTVRVSGRVLQPGGVTGASVGIRVRSLPQEELMFVAHTAGCGVTLPDAGDFEVEIDVRMNVAPGAYRVQAAAWHVSSSTELARGRSIVIAVDPVPSSSGRVFASPRIRLVTPL